MRVRFPEGRRVVVEDIGSSGGIGTDATDTGAEEVGINRDVLVVEDDLALDIEGFGTVDVEGGVLPAPSPKVDNRPGKSLQVV